MDSANLQQLKRGTLEMILLSLIAEGRCRHGYAMLNELSQAGGDFFRAPKAGSIYPVLYRMEEKGWVRAAQADARQKQYEITDTGKAALRQMKEEWRGYTETVAHFLEGDGA